MLWPLYSVAERSGQAQFEQTLLEQTELEQTAAKQAQNQTSGYGYRVRLQTPHNSNSFTQGIVLYRDQMIESSGLYGKSFVQVQNIQETSTTEIQLRPSKTYLLPETLFAEDITLLNDQLYLLTWKSGRLLRFQLPELTPLTSQYYDGEGWGLTRIDEQWIMSNGTDSLQFRNVKDFALEKSLTVLRAGHPVERLNALTYDGTFIWANIWKDERIIAIDPHTGMVKAELNLSELVKREDTRNAEHVLNGLTWDEQRRGLWVTGKRWNNLYLLDIFPISAPKPM